MQINIALPDVNEQYVQDYIESWGNNPDDFEVTRYKQQFTIVITNNLVRTAIFTAVKSLEDKFNEQE